MRRLHHDDVSVCDDPIILYKMPLFGEINLFTQSIIWNNSLHCNQSAVFTLLYYFAIDLNREVSLIYCVDDAPTSSFGKNYLVDEDLFVTHLPNQISMLFFLQCIFQFVVFRNELSFFNKGYW